VIARRLIAERCLYGVDLNPLAVELAKLSIWLVTLAKGRPFGFLDHNLRCGDSLLGIHRLDQLTELNMNPGQTNTQMRVFGRNIEQAVREAIDLRQQLRKMPIRDIHDVAAMARLDADARHRLAVPERIADAFIGEVFRTSGNGPTLEAAIASIAIQADHAINGDQDAIKAITCRGSSTLVVDLPEGRSARRPFHWPLAFPEVFTSNSPGFSALIGNPPFLGGRRITYRHSEKLLAYLKSWLKGAAGTTDLCVYFLIRASVLTKRDGFIGLIVSDIVSQGESRVNGLERLISEGYSIYSCISSMEWPGAAGVKISLIHIAKERWRGAVKINGVFTDGTITSFLQNSRDQSEVSPYPLSANEDSCFSGHYLMGQGFVVTAALRSQLINANAKNSEVIFPYIKGDDINNEPSQTSGLYAINFSMRELDECEINYPECLALIRELVKPERDAVKGKADRERWWRYAEGPPWAGGSDIKTRESDCSAFYGKIHIPNLRRRKKCFCAPAGCNSKANLPCLCMPSIFSP
jgi:hypothetical protein